jgi:hypothetical protein
MKKIEQKEEQKMFQEYLQKKGLSTEDFMNYNSCTKDIIKLHFRIWLSEKKS